MSRIVERWTHGFVVGGEVFVVVYEAAGGEGSFQHPAAGNHLEVLCRRRCV
jgi:hypothetical protein